MKKVSSMQMKLKMLAIFVAGLAVATFGWWEADRLDLAMGSDAGINEVRSGGWVASAPQKCIPGDMVQTIRKVDGCNILKTVTTCAPKREYISYAKTKSGTNMMVHPMATKGATEVVSYDNSVEDKQVDVKAEYDKVSTDLKTLQKGKTNVELSKDPGYTKMLQYKQDLDKVVKTNPRCLPVQTLGKPVAR